MSLFAELKRRRVFRVAGAYVLGAWVVLQVADVIFPALGLPGWAIKLVVGLVILGFPLALLLGWAFDLTPGGIERTGRALELSFPTRAAVIGTLIVATGVLGFVSVRHRAVASKLDMNAVAILPFRVLGGTELMVMREGMVDLLAAKLTGEGGARAIDSRTTLALWRKTVASEKDDLDPRASLQLARKLGAGNVMLGEMLGTSGEIVVNVKLYSAVDGAVIESVEEKSSPEDMLKLVDRVVTRLLSAQAGEGHRAAALTSESLPAVRAYLSGARLYRLGNQDSAAVHFNKALAEDSTFALAGMYLALSRVWTGFGPDYRRGRNIAWQHRDRLPQRERELIDAWLGANYPQPQTATAAARSLERLTEKYPDMVDAWYLRGDNYYHLGAVGDVEQPIDKALEAWSRALQLDSAYAPALEHQPTIYAQRGDTTNLRRVARLLYERMVPDDKLTASSAFVAAHGLRDEGWLSAWRADLADGGAAEVAQAVLNLLLAGLPQQDIDTLMATHIQMGSSSLRANRRRLAATYLVEMGRPGAAQRMQLANGAGDTEDALFAIWRALAYPDADRAAAAAAARMLEPIAARPDTTADYYSLLCSLDEWRVVNGEPNNAIATTARVRAYVAEHPETKSWLGACALGLEILTHGASSSPQLRSAVERGDSAILHMPIVSGSREHLVHFVVRGYQQLGDAQNALKVARRMQTDMPWARSTVMLERARLAAQVGRRDEAIDVYQQYLKLRANVEPGSASEQLVTLARRELAALTGEM